MTKEQVILVRKNEENFKLTKQLEYTIQKIVDENETIAPSPSMSDDESNKTSTSTEIQQFFARKNVFITGGTGNKIVLVIYFHVCWNPTVITLKLNDPHACATEKVLFVSL